MVLAAVSAALAGEGERGEAAALSVGVEPAVAVGRLSEMGQVAAVAVSGLVVERMPSGLGLGRVPGAALREAWSATGVIARATLRGIAQIRRLRVAEAAGGVDEG